MSKIGIENPLKQVEHKSWQMYWISMNLKWFIIIKKKWYSMFIIFL